MSSAPRYYTTDEWPNRQRRRRAIRGRPHEARGTRGSPRGAAQRAGRGGWSNWSRSSCYLVLPLFAVKLLGTEFNGEHWASFRSTCGGADLDARLYRQVGSRAMHRCPAKAQMLEENVSDRLPSNVRRQLLLDASVWLLHLGARQRVTKSRGPDTGFLEALACGSSRIGPAKGGDARVWRQPWPPLCAPPPGLPQSWVAAPARRRVCHARRQGA